MAHGNGGPLPSPILVRAVELTADGDWYDYDALVLELGKLVPPGRAMRRIEATRLRGGPPQRYVQTDTSRQIASGRREVVSDFLRHPWFEKVPAGKQPRGVKRQVRLVQVPASIARPQRAK